jgi:hypothetical protein
MNAKLIARTLTLSLVPCTLAATLGASAIAQTTPPVSPGILVPGYGPGVAGNVTVGPTRPVCLPNDPCTRPFAGARVNVLNSLRQPVASAITNSLGNFLLSVPSDNYIIHVQTTGLPFCAEARAAVGPKTFTLVAIDCDSGIR